MTRIKVPSFIEFCNNPCFEINDIQVKLTIQQTTGFTKEEVMLVVAYGKSSDLRLYYPFNIVNYCREIKKLKRQINKRSKPNDQMPLLP